MTFATMAHESPSTSSPESGQGRFVLQTGLGHNGSKWLATVLNRPEWGIKATHERKNDSLGQPWDVLLRRELNQGIDRVYLPYLEALDRDLNDSRVVLDANSWQMCMVPELHRAFPIDLTLLVVRNGIPAVESMWRHNQGTPQLEWLESVFLRHYWHLLGKPGDEFTRLSSFEKWCFWWSLNAEMLPRLKQAVGADRVVDVRFEDLTRDPAEFRRVLGLVLGDENVPDLSDDDIRALQGQDINRKLDGDRSPEAIWERWSDDQQAAFHRFCAAGMSQWGYSIPGQPAAVVETTVSTPGSSVDLPTVPLPSNPSASLDVLEADRLHELMGWTTPFHTSPLSARKAFKDWKMEEDDQPLFRYLWRQHQPLRHLEFGTWQGDGAIYVLEETRAAIWTVNLLTGETDDSGRNAYSFYAHEREELVAWARRIGFEVPKNRGFATDSLGFIGRRYLMRDMGNRVCQIYSDSTRWDDTPYPDGFFDSALVDGGHTAEVVESDTRKALRLVRPGGLIVWHDVCPELYGKTETVTGVFDGLARVLDDVKASTSLLAWLKPSFLLLGVKK